MIYLQHRELLEKIGLKISTGRGNGKRFMVHRPTKGAKPCYADFAFDDMSEIELNIVIRGAIATLLIKEEMLTILHEIKPTGSYFCLQELGGYRTLLSIHNSIDEANIAALQALTKETT